MSTPEGPPEKGKALRQESPTPEETRSYNNGANVNANGHLAPIERKQLQITPKLLGLNIPLSRAQINARSETRLSRDVAVRIFRMAGQPRWYAYSSIKTGARYRDVAAVYHVSRKTGRGDGRLNTGTQ
jgi:hypothetical protein